MLGAASFSRSSIGDVPAFNPRPPPWAPVAPTVPGAVTALAPPPSDVEPDKLDPDRPRVLRPRANLTPADRRYRWLATTAASSALVLMGLVFLFLLVQAWPALRVAGWSFLTETEWRPDDGTFGVAAALFGTIVIAVIALGTAVPFSVATALFINEYSPRATRRPLVALVDLLAAVPSLIYGLWGRDVLMPAAFGPARWLSDHLGFIPLFQAPSGDYNGSYFMAGLVVALMVVPIVTSVVREVFAQAPAGEREAAFALGGTRWGMIRTVVLPFGRGGVIGGSMLGLGRALGETIAVLLVLNPAFELDLRILDQGGNSVARLIADEFPEASNFGVQALIAAGLALFMLTLLVNMAANVVISRSRSGAGVEL